MTPTSKTNNNHNNNKKKTKNKQPQHRRSKRLTTRFGKLGNAKARQLCFHRVGLQ